MQSFTFTTTAKLLDENSSLDFFTMFSDGQIDPEDEIRIDYDEDEDELTAVVVEDNAQFGHVIDPTSDKYDHDLVFELSELTHLEIYQ